jgi:hypothetical protein
MQKTGMYPRMKPTSKDDKGIKYTGVLPYLYRYENEKWIDDFINNGKLLIGCFLTYQKYTDNQLGDTGEGHILHHLETQDKKTVLAVTTLGDNCYSFARPLF